MSTDMHAAGADAAERGISPVVGAGGRRSGVAGKTLGTVSLVALCGVLLWSSWRRAPAEAEPRTNPTISVATPFERARERPPEPAQVAASPPQAGLEAAARVERSPSNELLDTSRRAPVLVFNRPPQGRPAGEASGSALSLLASPTLPSGASAEARNELLDRLKPTPLDGVRATRLPNRDLVVAQGTAIPCALETAMSSDVPGFVSCVVGRDVMSDSGHVVLMEKGTQLVGEYRGGVRRGSSRMFVLWNRARTPTGVIVNLASPATDALGRAGFDGEIDSHFWERFGGALLLSIVGDAGQIAGSQLSESGIQVNTVQSGSRSAAAIATEQSANIAPTLAKNQGELVSIFVARDLDFSGVYALRRIGSQGNAARVPGGAAGSSTEILDRAAGRPSSVPVYKP